MRQRINFCAVIVWLTAICSLPIVAGAVTNDVVRPEEIKSKRLVVYDTETYEKLADLWKDYHDEYPSEYAYANWMYAARYAGRQDYPELLEKGLKKYPANPVLLYLTSMRKSGAADVSEERKYLQEAVRIAPGYMDPWFSLVIVHMTEGDEERIDVALRTLLEGGVIADEIMDYNYNVLTGLEENAILITNGDNDTYPVWILTRILDVRPDVSVVNRSLLNSEWYPLYVIERGLPRFIGENQLLKLRDETWKSIAKKGGKTPAGVPVGDTLIKLIVASAERAGRPVYFAGTMYRTEELKGLFDRGRQLGLASRVTSTERSYADELEDAFETWLQDYRTGGLTSWRLLHSGTGDAGRSLIMNYAAVIAGSLADLKKHAPELREEVFNWYIDYVEPLLTEDWKHKAAMAWACYANDISKIDRWSKKQGIECPRAVTQ